jgi:hypothetical protein
MIQQQTQEIPIIEDNGSNQRRHVVGRIHVGNCTILKKYLCNFVSQRWVLTPQKKRVEWRETFYILYIRRGSEMEKKTDEGLGCCGRTVGTEMMEKCFSIGVLEAKEVRKQFQETTIFFLWKLIGFHEGKEEMHTGKDVLGKKHDARRSLFVIPPSFFYNEQQGNVCDT